MADISACSGVPQEKGKVLLSKPCVLRFDCKRYEAHLNSTSQYQSYISAKVQNGKCEMQILK